MHTKNFLITLLLSTSTVTLAATPQETEFEVLDKYMFPMRKATADYNSKFTICEKIEEEKPPLKASDLTFLTQRQAQIMVFRARRIRLSACLYAEENALIRRHIELLTFLRSENLFPDEVERLDKSLDLYYGLEGNFDQKTRKEYELIPEALRSKFEQVIKDKSLEVDIFEITESLPK